jgi:hypothetical protein
VFPLLVVVAHGPVAVGQSLMPPGAVVVTVFMGDGCFGVRAEGA